MVFIDAERRLYPKLAKFTFRVFTWKSGLPWHPHESGPIVAGSRVPLLLNRAGGFPKKKKKKTPRGFHEFVSFHHAPLLPSALGRPVQGEVGERGGNSEHRDPSGLDCERLVVWRGLPVQVAEPAAACRMSFPAGVRSPDPVSRPPLSRSIRRAVFLRTSALRDGKAWQQPGSAGREVLTLS